MFDFLFRRFPKRNESQSPENRQVSDRAAQKEGARLAALMQAEEQAGDEDSAVAFILGCQFADARLKAAESIQSRQALEQVRNATRNIDRRVAKMMQTRLDAIRQAEKTEHDASACIADARRLALETMLTPSQAADLDRRWQFLEGVPEDLRHAFDDARSEIADRLLAQATLQRAVMDALSRLRQVAESSPSLTSQELSQVLDGLAAEITRLAASRELPSLPRNLLPVFEEEFQRLKRLQEEHEKHQLAAAERLEALARWEGCEPSTLDHDELDVQWRSMQRADDDSMAALQARYEALTSRLSGREKPHKPQREDQQAVYSVQTLSEALDEMEKALQEGALQQAAERDEMLRSLDQKGVRIDASQADRLSNLRSELKRLQDWARWSGRASRDELIRTVEELPSLSLPLKDLASKVSDARNAWKSLDASSGAAPKAMWEQFDAACSKAYAPVAENSRRMAEERATHAEAAQRLIAQVREFMAEARLDAPAQEGVDWKSVSAFYLRMRQSWQQLGTMDRKERKRLDAEFEHAISALQKPLEQKWQAEIERRQQLIGKVLELDPMARGTGDSVKRLQEQWQEGARNMPLASREEQRLWKQFRQACDDLFERRKEASDAAGETRKQNLLAREALCARMEEAVDAPVSDIVHLLQEAAAEWSVMGSVPKARENDIHRRYRAAVSALEGRVDAAESEARQANYQTLFEKLTLCLAAEAALTGKGEKDEIGWNLHWQVLPQLEQKQESMLRARFDAALEALSGSDSLYAGLLESNRAQMLRELLHLEILLGLESPPEFSQERLKMQMSVLQDSLAGNKETAQKAQVNVLCSLPALTDELSAERIATILRAVSGAE